MIYALLLEQNKIYVGYSARPVGERFIEHFNANGCEWTSLYRPLEVLLIREGGPSEENELTLEMMEKYGWYNVRGGCWCKIDMDKCPPALLKHKGLKTPVELKQHGPKPTARTSVKRRTLPQYESTTGKRPKTSGTSEKRQCRGPANKTRNDSCAKSLAKGNQRVNTNSTTGSTTVIRVGHYEVVVPVVATSHRGNGCYRCGRDSHFASSCYAKKHVDGHVL
ncbi:CCHC-type domain-containing protein [Plasmodiophora brassicae]|uniref:CCHC-type domain-containing protein n=1 Tax=Plasmodiophora brassicae TaxID=37360 RepID=A0A0G4IGN4_PLABS|nr:hypothetical protein PBRA_000143 [Plasmodiophora brassicae]